VHRVRDKTIRYLTEAEFTNIWEAEKIEEWRFMYLMGLLTALRLSDILALRSARF
jgi:integrase